MKCRAFILARMAALGELKPIHVLLLGEDGYEEAKRRLQQELRDFDNGRET